MNSKKQDKVLFQEENKLNKPNILINIIHQKSLSIKPKKVYNLFIRKLLDQNVEDFNTRTISTSVSEITRELGVQNRKEIRGVLEDLRKQLIVFEHTIDDKAYIVSTGLISGYAIEKKGRESLKIFFDEKLTQEILKYNNRYTKLDLIEMNNLQVSHSLSLYELFKSKLYIYRFQNQDYTEKKLREKLGLINEYDNIKDFNQKVIRKAIADINKNTLLKVELLKILRPNTKANPKDERLYKFKLTQDVSKLIKPAQFRDFLKSRGQTISHKIRAHTYTLELEEITDSNYRKFENKTEEELYENKVWLRASGDMTTREISFRIWSELFNSFLKDQDKFLEDHDLDIEDFIEWDSQKPKK